MSTATHTSRTTDTGWITFIDGNARAKLSADGTKVIAAEYEGRTVTPAELAYQFCRTPNELVVLVQAIRDEAARTQGARR